LEAKFSHNKKLEWQGFAPFISGRLSLNFSADEENRPLWVEKIDSGQYKPMCVQSGKGISYRSVSSKISGRFACNRPGACNDFSLSACKPDGSYGSGND